PSSNAVILRPALQAEGSAFSQRYVLLLLSGARGSNADHAAAGSWRGSKSRSFAKTSQDDGKYIPPSTIHPQPYTNQPSTINRRPPINSPPAPLPFLRNPG